ncbi:MAG TPA: MYXO-CTERM sorting domain-containing protein, partial [Polyangiaceae bacterium]|nr:MYXO-CTERM sorting domain-containing protein [Polyangiaceae bacterium]
VLDAEGTRSTFVMGGLASAMMANSQEDVDSFTGAWQSMYLPGDSVSGLHAYNSSLALLYGLNVTGLMWNPAGANPTPVTEPALNDQPGNLLVNGDFDEGFQGWSFANLQPGGEANRAQGYAMHRDGELQIRIQRAAPVATETYEIRLSQPVSIQAGQNYKISLKARSANPRPLHVNIEVPNGGGVIGSLGNHQDAKAPVMTTADMLTYDWVFASTAAATANFEIDSGDSAETLIIDDVVLAPTTDPVSVAGDQAGQPPPGSTNGTTPPAGGGSTAGGGGSATPGGTTGQTIPNQGDLGSTSGGSSNSSSGATTGALAPVNGALPPAPAGGPGGNGTCKTDADCGGFKCSTTISLCYEPTYGYVWDAKANNGQGGWSQPPVTDQCKPYVFWPLKNGCYDPVTGYAFDPQTGQPVFVGEQYQANNTGKSSSGCSVSGVGEKSPAPAWALLGMLGTAFGLAYRRRR